MRLSDPFWKIPIRDHREMREGRCSHRREGSHPAGREGGLQMYKEPLPESLDHSGDLSRSGKDGSYRQLCLVI